MIGSVITEVLSLMGMAHGYASGVRMEKDIQKLVKATKRQDKEIEKLADNIYYDPSTSVLSTDDREKPSIITDLRLVKQGLEPVQKMTGLTILSSAYIPTPKQMLKAFGKNPWEFLDNIRPFQHSKPHSNPDMVPILFGENEVYYIGWQMRGTFPILFGCHYTPSIPFKPVIPVLTGDGEKMQPKTSTPKNNKIPRKPKKNKPVNKEKEEETQSESESLTCAKCGKTFESQKSHGCLYSTLLFLFAFIGATVAIVIDQSESSAFIGMMAGIFAAMIIMSFIETPRSECPVCNTPIESGLAKD